MADAGRDAVHRAGRSARRPGTTARAVTVAAVLTLALPAAAAAAAWGLGVPLLPPPDAVPADAAPAPPSPSARVVAEEVPPAVTATAEVLATGPGTGWAAAGPVSWATASVIDTTCPATSGPAPTVVAQRTFTRGRSGMTVAVTVFGAGQGGLALDLRRSRLTECSAATDGVAAWAVRTGSVAAIAAAVRPAGTTTPVSSLTWRRGDVLLSVLGSGANPESLGAIADAVDRTAQTALRSRCLDLDAPATDAARSPWGDRASFAGRQASQRVALPAGGLPVPPVGVTPVAFDVRLEAPAPVVRRETPAVPVWPAALPPEVPLPVPPLAPGPEPTVNWVTFAAADPAGPGCGWAFTGQAAPGFDSAAGEANRQAAVESASSRLAIAQESWRASVIGYWQAVARFQAASAAYARYARDVRSVTRAWARTEAAWQRYRDDVAAYQAALTERDRVLSERAAADAVYRAAVAACAAPPVPPPAVPSAPGGTAPGGTAPGGTAGTGGPGSTATTAPGVPADPAPVCPPPRPAVLDQPPPPVPVAPTPPPDPRPTASPPPPAPTTPAGIAAG